VIASAVARWRTIQSRAALTPALQVSQRLAYVYAQLHAAVSDAHHRYAEPEGILLHAPQQIQTLLDCE
jgi:hypothetical protein